MQDTFYQLMEAYIKCYLESEQGQSAMKYSMISYINQHCIRRLNEFQDNASDPFSFLYRPCSQIETLLTQCDTVSTLLKQYSNHIVPDSLSNAVLGIHECCIILSTYVSVIKFEVSTLTKLVDQIIQSNYNMLAQSSYKPRTMTREEYEIIAQKTSSFSTQFPFQFREVYL